MAKKSNSGRRVSEFTATSFLTRFVFALVLVLITYNPSGVSAFDWVYETIVSGDAGAVQFLAGVILLIGWTILLVATWRSLDTFGVILVVLLFGGLVWLLIESGMLEPDSFGAITWLVLVSLAGLLAIGLSWSHIWRRMTGQFDTNEDD